MICTGTKQPKLLNFVYITLNDILSTYLEFKKSYLNKPISVDKMIKILMTMLIYKCLDT